MTSAPATSPDPGARGAVAVLLALVFISLIGFGIVIPLLPFFATVFEAEAWQVTLLFAIYSAGQFLGELTWGRLSDRIGRRPVLLITILASAAGYVALAYAPNIWLAVLARAAAGFFSGNISAIQGYIVDVSPPQRLAGRLGLVGSAFGVGFVVGPAVGGLLAQPDLGAAGFRPPLLLAAGLCVAAAAGLVLFVKESRRPRAEAPPRRNTLTAAREFLDNPVIAPVFATIFFGFFASSALWSVLGLWFEARFGWGPREVGLAMALTGVAAAATQGLVSGMMVRRLGAGVTIAGGLVVAGATLFAMAASPDSLAAAAALIVSVIGHALWQPAATALVSRSSDLDRQGAALGAAGATGSLARVCGPVAAGFLFSAMGPSAPIVFAGFAMLPGAWLGWRAAQALKARDEAGP